MTARGFGATRDLHHRCVEAFPTASTPASVASGPPDASRGAAGRSVRQQHASVGPRHADGASEWPVAHRNGDSPSPSKTYVRRSPVPDRACPTRPRRRAASTSPDARRRGRSFGWCQIIGIGSRRFTTSASRASTARARPSHRCVRLPRRHRPPHGDRRSDGAHGARARPRARRRPSLGAGEVGDRAVCSTNSRLTPTEIPILRPPRRSDSAQSSSRAAKCSSGVSRRPRRPRFRCGRHRRLWRVWWPHEGRLRPRRFLPERHRKSSGLADGRPSAVFWRRSRRREYY